VFWVKFAPAASSSAGVTFLSFLRHRSCMYR
jgi:hypothetical protein